MNDIYISLIVVGCTIILVWGIFLLVQNKQKEDTQKIQAMAVEKGWKMETIQEPLAWGTCIRASNWTLEAVSRSVGPESISGSSNVAMSTIWKAPASGSTLLIGIRTSQKNLGSLGAMLTQQIIQQALGVAANDVKEIKFGNPEFQKQFMVWAKDAQKAEQLLTPTVQAALCSWSTHKPLVKWIDNILSIEIPGVNIKKAEELNKLIQLGECFI
jgi:hypothetical protein